jgi:anaerobic selenocysteine-containing dehydrogenase
VEVRVELTDRVMPGVVSIPHGWGHDRPGTGQLIAAAHAGVSINDLTDEQAVDAASGNAVLSGVRVTVEAVAPAVVPEP